MTKQINFSNPGEIDPSRVKKAVYSGIDFPLSEEQWTTIENAFEQTWNVDIGLRGAFYREDILDAVAYKLKGSNLLIDPGRVEKVVNIILDYIENNGGLLED